MRNVRSLGATSFRDRFFPWQLALGAALLVGLLSYLNGIRYVAAQGAVRESLAARAAMTETLSSLKDAETGVRGFLLTGDARFLEPYDLARPRIATSLVTLAKLGEADPSQRESARRVSGLTQQKLDLSRTLVARPRQSAALGQDEIQLLVEGKATMDAIRVEIASMLARADARLGERERALTAAALRLQLVVGAALLGGVLFTLAGLWNARRDAARARETNERLAADLAAREHAEIALRDQTRLLESVLESLADGVVVLEKSRKLAIINPAGTRFFPWDLGEVTPKDWSMGSRAFLPDGKTLFPPEHGPLTRAVQGHAADNVEMVIRVPSGELRSYIVTARPILSEGTTIGAVGVFRDTTDLDRAQKELRESEHRYRVLSEASFEGVAISKGGQLIDTNANFARWLGYDPAEMIGMSGMSTITPEDRERVAQLSQSPDVSYETHMVRRDGTTFPVEIRGRFVQFRGELVRIAAVRDVTEKKLREAQLLEKSEQLRALSLRDELTGLHNRRGFMEVAGHQMKAAVRTGKSCAVFFVDLNGMKQINDELGHEMGDHAIRAAADVLRGVFRSSDAVSRLGGDEFAVFASECDPDGVAATCARIERAVVELNARSTSRYRLSISTGAAVWSADSPLDLFGLMQAADAQMYQAKRARMQRGSLRVLPG